MGPKMKLGAQRKFKMQMTILGIGSGLTPGRLIFYFFLFIFLLVDSKMGVKFMSPTGQMEPVRP